MTREQAVYVYQEVERMGYRAVLKRNADGTWSTIYRDSCGVSVVVNQPWSK